MNRFIVTIAALTLVAADWPQFRGPGGTAVSPEKGLPDKLGPADNLKWKIGLPGRGLSCPVIADGVLYLTANSGMNMTRLHVLAFDASTGKQLWERQFFATGQTLCHPKTCMAAPTPVTDGKFVYALFASNDLVCLSADGDVRWVKSLEREYPKMTNHVGRASSPVLAGGVLVVDAQNQGESLVLGVDTAYGKTLWKVPREQNNNWASPVTATRGGKPVVLVQSGDGMVAIEPTGGQVDWNFDAEKLHPIASPTPLADGRILAPGRGMVMLKTGDKAEVAWKTAKFGASTASPVAADGRLYTVTSRDSVVKCASLDDGKELWDQRVKGPFSASPVIGDGKIYFVSEEGVVTVLRAGDKAEVLSVGELKDTILATPAIANGCIFLRSDKHLYCFRTDKPQS